MIVLPGMSRTGGVGRACLAVFSVLSAERLFGVPQRIILTAEFELRGKGRVGRMASVIGKVALIPDRLTGEARPGEIRRPRVVTEEQHACAHTLGSLGLGRRGCCSRTCCTWRGSSRSC